ncbi:MAG: hypothetical protein C0623_10440 [Desulfuromonas sp.]|nr:MAG: hypothetical protein C0623_10440 [Desulfuromonas sp.]
MDSNSERERKFNIAGWVLFIVCALFFLAAGIKHDDIWTIIGSLIFLVACFVFLVPLAGRDDNR